MSRQPPGDSIPRKRLKYGITGYPQTTAPADIVDYLTKHLRPEDSVLDLGCGRGSLLRGLRSKGWTGKFCGVEIDSR